MLSAYSSIKPQKTPDVVSRQLATVYVAGGIANPIAESKERDKWESSGSMERETKGERRKRGREREKQRGRG